MLWPQMYGGFCRFKGHLESLMKGDKFAAWFRFPIIHDILHKFETIQINGTESGRGDLGLIKTQTLAKVIPDFKAVKLSTARGTPTLLATFERPGSFQ